MSFIFDKLAPLPQNLCFKRYFKSLFSPFQCKKTVLKVLKTWYFPYSAFRSTSQWDGLQPPPILARYWFHASILLLIAVELVHQWSINFISVKLFECYYGPLVRCVDTGWCYVKRDKNCNCCYYYNCSSVQREQQC